MMSMTVLLPDLTTKTVNADSYAVDDEGNLLLSSGSNPVAAFAVNHWAGVWVTNQVTTP